MPSLKQLTIRLDKKVYKSLKSICGQNGRKMADVIREALSQYLSYSEAREVAGKMREASEKLIGLVRGMEDELSDFRAELTLLRRELRELRKAIEVNCFWSALAVELIKSRIFNSKVLTKDEYEMYKKVWMKAHEKADERIEVLLNKRIWNKKFNPEK